MKTSILILAALSLCGCAYPTSSIEQGSEPGHLRFVDAPVGALISIDGQLSGGINTKGPTLIAVRPGKHTVEEVVDGRIVFRREYEVDAGSKIEIGGRD